MSAGGWTRLMELCLGALERPPAERAVWLDGACAGDRALKAEGEGLLAQEDPDFLENPIVRMEGLAAPEATPGDSLERRIGPYRIVRPLGHGGMGEVFLAIQEGDGFERPVALKVVRPGMATDDVLARFRLERRILAGLSHPNLAKLIDGGATEDGLPYFVMEYVEGVPITEHCEQAGASVEERLRLFMDVCDAVHHAHQSLVVHRDIKPGNILVTRDGAPKLLDFGIGKVLDPTEGPDRTLTVRRVLTPEYASPEQLRGGVITTATDVHGLGLLLYQLLTGRHPFADDATTTEEVDRALRETNPTSPSTRVGAARPRLRRALRGDLDNIVLKALRKEPERRYASVEALRADVERHLEGRPIRARPDSVRYRLSKFVSRNPWGVAAAALALVALGTAIVVPWRQNRQLLAERDKALAVQGFLLEGFGTTGGDETIGARDLLDRQAARLDTAYADRPELRAEMLLVLSDAYERLGLYAEAIPPAERALELLVDVHPDDHADVARAYNTLGWALYRGARLPEAAALLAEAVAIRRRLGRPSLGELSRSLNDLGVVRNAMGEFETAEALHREAFEIRSEVLGDSELATGISASNLAAALYQLGRYDEAREQMTRALELMRRAVGPDHQRTVTVQNNGRSGSRGPRTPSPPRCVAGSGSR